MNSIVLKMKMDFYFMWLYDVVNHGYEQVRS